MDGPWLKTSVQNYYWGKWIRVTYGRSLVKNISSKLLLREVN